MSYSSLRRKSPMKRPCRPMVQHRYHSIDTRQGKIDELDKLTSLIVRQRDGECVTCHRTDELTASHFYSRRWLHVRFDLVNVHAQCWTCNQIHSLNPWPYLHFLLDTYGDDVLTPLHQKRMSREPVQDSTLDELIVEYRLMLQAMSKAA